MDIQQILFTASVWVLPILFAVTLHEAAHGYVARMLGDPTAERAGRISLNPLRHIDPFGTILLPALLLLSTGGRFLFGFAKPVPVNYGNLANPKRDMIWVALAGPGANIVMIVLAILLLRVSYAMPESVHGWVVQNCINAMWINALLAMFNMLPIPPLDGGRVAVGLLPHGPARQLQRLEPVGIFIVIGLVLLLPLLGRTLGADLNVFRWIVLDPAQFLLKQIYAIFGPQA